MNNLKKSDKWKIQLTIANNFISSIDHNEDCVMHSKGDNMKQVKLKKNFLIHSKIDVRTIWNQ